MADISVTASAIRGTQASQANAGATIAAGNVCYRDSNNVLQLSDSNVVAAAKVDGIALNGGDSGQPITLHSNGSLTLNAVLTAGTFYYLSATPGKICPLADLTTGSRLVVVGYAVSATVLNVHIIDTGVVL